MPVTDLLTRVTDSTTGRPVISALAAPKAIGAATASLTDVTNWTTSSAIHFVIYETTASGIKDPTTQTDWKGTLSGTTISNLTLTGGTDRAYSTGAKVELTPTARFAKDLYDNLSAHANQDGSLKTSAVQAALNIAASSTDWTPLANTPTLASSAGQREHVLQFTGVNYTDRLQAGTKLQIPRTGTTPTTSMAFVSASSQYASKSSPTGITFTDDFTCEAWVYLDSYAQQSVISRYTAGSDDGFDFSVGANGTVILYGAGTSTRRVDSYQSIPLNKWTHIVASLDMSAGVGAVYIDGVLVPSLVAGAGTSLIQSGNLQLASNGAGTSPLNGKIANARVWSTIRTAAQIRDNMNQETPASTTGLVAHFKGNGSWNDSSSNANHLTAVGGAVNNSAAHPYSATEYAIVTKTEYTGGNTAVTVFTGSNCLPNETLGTASYSSTRAPYGFPTDRTKWSVGYYHKVQATQSAPGTTVRNLGSVQTILPVGAWLIEVQFTMGVGLSGAGNTYLKVGLSTSSSSTTQAYYGLTAVRYINIGTSFYSIDRTSCKTAYAAQVTAQQTLYLTQQSDAAASTIEIRNDFNNDGGYITAECAYL